MIAVIRRRLSQIRQVGSFTAVRIALSRLIRLIIGWCDYVRIQFVSPGLAAVDRERLPMRIVPIGSRSCLSIKFGLIPTQFALLNVGPVEMGRSIEIDQLPRTWRTIALQLTSFIADNPLSIDWHTDPGSKHSWGVLERSRSIRYGDRLGVEVKWPWELGRLQHLPPIAAAIGDEKSERGRQSAAIIKHHIVDFVRSNPPGFGVQWICPMDIGIRIANLLVAVDLARAAGIGFDDEFLRLVAATARDHGRYISKNLEWSERLCSNHYLANIAGLLYVGTYLNNDAEGSEWLAFAGREMVQQIRAQFHEEGSNFEASTCYHRLSAEIAIHSVALMLWISRHQPERAARWWSGSARCFHPSPVAPPTPRIKWTNGFHHPIDEDLQRRLWGMGKFTESLLRKDGSIPQIGDNDSGRFMRLEISDQPYADIDDHRHLVHASRALFGMCDGVGGHESAWISRWLGDAVLPTPGSLTTEHWTQFGLYTWRCSAYHLTLRCGHVGQLGNGGHAHCDQLSITLTTADGSVIDDPGTGVYTPDPDLRNQLRSSACHSTVLVPNQEQGEWLPGRWGLFAMRDIAKARMLSFDQFGGSAMMFQGEAVVRRRLELAERSVRILDKAPKGSVANFVLGPKVIVESLSKKTADLRLGSTRIRLCGKALRLEECLWSQRYNCISSTKKISCAAGECVLQFE